MEAKRSETMPPEDGCIFNILGHSFNSCSASGRCESTRGCVTMLELVLRNWLWFFPEVLDFSPERVSKGSDIHVLSGTQGALVKINGKGETLNWFRKKEKSSLLKVKLVIESGFGRQPRGQKSLDT